MLRFIIGGVHMEIKDEKTKNEEQHGDLEINISIGKNS